MRPSPRHVPKHLLNHLPKHLLLSVSLLGSTACIVAPCEDTPSPEASCCGEEAPPEGTGLYWVSPSGIVCSQAPCPTLRISRSERPCGVEVVELDYPEGMPSEQRRAFLTQVMSTGAWARGEVVEKDGHPHFRIDTVTP